MESKKMFKLLLFVNVLAMVVGFSIGAFQQNDPIFNPFLSEFGFIFLLTIIATGLVNVPAKPYPVITLGLFGFISAFFVRDLVFGIGSIFTIINLVTTLMIAIALTARAILAYYGYTLNLIDKDKEKVKSSDK